MRGLPPEIHDEVMRVNARPTWEQRLVPPTAMSEAVRARIESYDKAYKVQNMNYIESEN